MLDAVYKVAYIVQVSGDFRKLDFVLGIPHNRKNVAAGVSNLADVRKAVLGKAQ